jgi:uncharacterized SAM-binding protein YcdF (DUF218 family)
LFRSWSYFQPALPIFLGIAIAGLVRAWLVCKDQKPWLLTAGVVGCFLLSWDPVAWLIALPLESPYPPASGLPDDAQAMVVLAGRVYPPNDFRPYVLAGEDTYQRCYHAAWLYKHGLSKPILVCGGGSQIKPFADTMREILESLGVPENQIWIDDRSASTHENARYGAHILRQHDVSRIALVSETIYLTRAVGCFRKEGLTVFPMPFGNGTVFGASDNFLPNWHAFESNGVTLHEIGGVLWYRLHGWI